MFIEGKMIKTQELNYIENIINKLNASMSLRLDSLHPDNTTLVIIDVINGFTREGPLKSDRIENIIDPIVEIMKKCEEKNITAIVFNDSHDENSPEFESYPPHCIRGTNESEVVDEIKNQSGYMLINKNSTNGFIESEFQKWLQNNDKITNFIITGDCTDICILQFALSIKAHFNMNNKRSKIIVPMNAIDTYDTDFHNGDIMNVFALEILSTNGIEIVKSIE